MRTVTQEDLFEIDWAARAAALHSAVTAAEAAALNCHRAKRLMRELTAYAGAAEASQHLADVIAKVPCGAAPLRHALTRLEGACAALTTAASPALSPSPALFTARIAKVCELPPS